MADTLTIKFPDGQADRTNVDPTNSATATGVGAKAGLIGPPLYGRPNTQGRYVCQTAGGSGNFRWIYDENIAGASPSTFLYVGLTT